MYQVSLKLQRLIFFTIILLLPSQLGRHFWPFWSYVAGLRVDYLSPTLYFTDVLILVLFVLWLSKNITFLKIKKFNVLFFLFFVFISVLLSKNQMAGIYGFIKLLEFLFFGFFVSKIIKTVKDFKIVLYMFCFGVFFESTLAIMQYINQGSIGGLLYFFGERTFTSLTPGIANASLNGKLVLRPYATFPHPNVLAGYLVIAMTMIVASSKYQVLSKEKRIYFLIALVIGTAALFLTMSRIAIILWIVVLFYFLKPLILNTKYLILFMVCIGSIVVSPFLSRFLSFSAADESVVRRVELTKTAMFMAKDHLIFGVGLYNFLPTLPYYQKSSTGSLFTLLQPVHNIYLLVLVETGIVGLLFFLWFIVKTYRRFKIYDLRFMILSIVLTIGIFDHYFLTLQQGQLLFAFVLGLCFSKDTQELV